MSSLDDTPTQHRLRLALTIACQQAREADVTDTDVQRIYREVWCDVVRMHDASLPTALDQVIDDHEDQNV